MIGSLPTGLGNPRGVTVDTNGDYIVVDTTDSDIWRVNPSNTAQSGSGYGRIGNLPSGFYHSYRCSFTQRRVLFCSFFNFKSLGCEHIESY